MNTFENHSDRDGKNLERRQNEFVDNRRWQQAALDVISDPHASEEQKLSAKTQLVRIAMENIGAAEADPRVVDKTVKFLKH